jgi:hypothetical protein
MMQSFRVSVCFFTEDRDSTSSASNGAGEKVCGAWVYCVAKVHPDECTSVHDEIGDAKRGGKMLKTNRKQVGSTRM